MNYANSKPGAAAVVARIDQKGGKVAIQGEVSKPGDIELLFSEIKKGFGTGQVIVAAGGKRM